jgi:hypothetical protein
MLMFVLLVISNDVLTENGREKSTRLSLFN